MDFVDNDDPDLQLLQQRQRTLHFDERHRVADVYASAAQQLPRKPRLSEGFDDRKRQDGNKSGVPANVFPRSAGSCDRNFSTQHRLPSAAMSVDRKARRPGRGWMVAKRIQMFSALAREEPTIDPVRATLIRKSSGIAMRARQGLRVQDKPDDLRFIPRTPNRPNPSNCF